MIRRWAVVSEKLSELIRLLDIEKVEENLFIANHPEGRTGRLYGGQIMAQALMGAIRTVPDDRYVHSIHGYFLRPGNPKTPAIVRVERLRDGGSFSTRRVIVQQEGRPIFTLDASFQIEEESFNHQFEIPEELEPPAPEKIPEYLLKEPFLSWRHEFRRLQSNSPQPPEQYVWIKANGEVPADRSLQTCLLVFESDNVLLGTCRLPHRGSYERDNMQVASLDHAMWFHRPINLEDWLLYSIDSPVSSKARGYTRGLLHSREGTLVASTIQEGLIRLH